MFQTICWIQIKVCFLPLGNNPDFKAGVLALANLLKIQRHDDYLVMLKVSVVHFVDYMNISMLQGSYN